LGVARRVTLRRRQVPQGFGQIVAQLLAEIRQMRIIERKPEIVFDDAQPFTGPVGGGIEDAQWGYVIHSRRCE
jgi:hypothetical protein